MAITKLRKARNLGGKIGKEVQNLLPPDKDTMGAIARLLSLHELSSVLGSKTGLIVWNSARGIDEEPVRETKRALTKSITAFKSFTVRSIDDVPKWIALLAADLFTRVKADMSRYNRHPTMCTIQYYYLQEGELKDGDFYQRYVYVHLIFVTHYLHCNLLYYNLARRDRIGKSMRIPFPMHYETSDQDIFCMRIQQLLLTKLDLTRIVRLGLCAVSFQDIAKNSIGNFFQQRSSLQKVNDLESTKIIDTITTKSKEATKRKEGNHNSDSVKVAKQSQSLPCEDKEDTDMQYAKKLQASYDRENSILSSSTRRSGVGHTKRVRSISSSSDKTRIENYFSKGSSNPK
jgi:nucleotidyltransferase/DNA polymerase involved in DNA repair